MRGIEANLVRCAAMLIAFVASPLPADAADPAATLPPLAIAGNLTTLEIAPVLLAADHSYPGKAEVRAGNLADLVAAPGAVAADVATNAETQLLLRSLDHPELRIVMTVSEGLYRIVARRSAGIATLADLRGKRIATLPGTSSAYFLHRMLATAGLSEADVAIVPASRTTDIPRMLVEKRVDAVTIWEPEIGKAGEAIGADAIEFPGKGVYRELFNLNTTAQALSDPARRRRIVALVRGIVAASRRIDADPSIAWPLVEKVSGYPHDLVVRSWPHQAYPAALVPDLLDVMVAEEAYLAAQAGRPPRSRAQIAALIDASVIEEASRAPKR